MFEVLHHHLDRIQHSDVLTRLDLKKGEFFVVSSHREENISSEKNFMGLINSLNILADKYQFPIIVSTHPRTRKMIESKQVQTHELIQFLKPMGFIDYNALQKNAFAVLSDSGTISEESSILNFRALNIRDAHERPEAMEEAAVMMVGMNSDRIVQGIAQLSRQEVVSNRNFRLVEDYAMPNVSEKVVRIIISYVDYIKRVVWQEGF
jgi:UDP-N-acetylglucosamine 2-epimerase (non-hydrolysing)